MKIRNLSREQRRGGMLVLLGLLLVIVFAALAFPLDIGVARLAKSQLQNSADSAALAGAWELLDEDELTGIPSMTEELVLIRSRSTQFGAANPVLQSFPQIDQNVNNDASGDVVIGRINDPNDASEQISFPDSTLYNVVQITVQKSDQRNGSVPTFFGQIFGLTDIELRASATAILEDGVIGYRIPPGGANADLLPIALHVDAWGDLMDASTNGTGGYNDDYSYDSTTESVVSTSDNILELNIYPGSGTDQLPPGNFGTVDIGSSNNSTADLARQIRYGVNEDDLAYFGGELVLGTDGTLTLNGDTGLSASIKDDLEAIKGEPRAIPLFDQVTGNGNNSMYRIVGFAGIRIVYVKLTGPMKKKSVFIQPAHCIDGTTVTDGSSGTSYFLYQRPRLVR